MRCYGRKEDWYLKKVPSGMLPALEVNGKLITESDLILLTLEEVFGSLGVSLGNPQSIKLRKLERRLFSAWCQWLCTPRLSNQQEERCKEIFNQEAKNLEYKLQETKGPFLDESLIDKDKMLPGVTDIIFVPYLERMSASLAYYKGFNVRKEFPLINKWFEALEKLTEYQGTQGDFHTHAHDLPPQMGGCWKNSNPMQEEFSYAIDTGVGLGGLETSWKYEGDDKNLPKKYALQRVIKHRKTLLDLNPLGPKKFDQPLRASLTTMLLNEPCHPNPGSANGLRYLRDRISVPRDMNILSARYFRNALEKTAQIDGPSIRSNIPTRNRFDQDPIPFKNMDN